MATSKNHDNKSSLLKQSHPQVHLQQTDGDPALQRHIGPGTRFSFEGLLHINNNFQPKLGISKPDDVFEQQADRIAEQVMSIPEVDVNRSAARSPTQGWNDALQGKCACRDSEESNECVECQQQEQQNLLQRSAVHETTPLIAAHIVHEVLRSPGQPLGPATLAFMERRFSHDFSKVRVHTDAKAAESAQAVNALAYTVGPDIVFRTGQYAPESSAGRRLWRTS